MSSAVPLPRVPRARACAVVAGAARHRAPGARTFDARRLRIATLRPPAQVAILAAQLDIERAQRRLSLLRDADAAVRTAREEALRSIEPFS